MFASRYCVLSNQKLKYLIRVDISSNVMLIYFDDRKEALYRTSNGHIGMGEDGWREVLHEQNCSLTPKNENTKISGNP